MHCDTDLHTSYKGCIYTYIGVYVGDIMGIMEKKTETTGDYRGHNSTLQSCPVAGTLDRGTCSLHSWVFRNKAVMLSIIATIWGHWF